MKMNRHERRQMSRYGIGQQVLKDAFAAQYQKTQRDAYNNAFAAMLLVLAEEKGYRYKRIREVAVKTIRNINATMCAQELIDKLKALTGFDVNEPLNDNECGMEGEL